MPPHEKHRLPAFLSYLKRIFSFRHMDFEVALWQMFYLCIAPRRV